MTISRREKILLFILVYLIIIFIFGRFFYMPQVNTINDLKKENEELQTAVFNLEEKKSSFNKKSNRNDLSIDQELQLIDQKIPLEADLITVLEYIDISFNKCNLPLSSLKYSYGNTQKNDHEIMLTIDLKTEGNIYSLINLIQLLEESPRFSIIENIRFSAQRKQSNNTITNNVNEAPPTIQYFIIPPGAPEPKGSRIEVGVENELGFNNYIEKQTKVSENIKRGVFQMELQLHFFYYYDEDAIGNLRI